MVYILNWDEISSTFYYWYYLDLLLDCRFIHILNSALLKLAESLQDRPEFYNSTSGAKKWHSKDFNMGKTNKWIPKFIGSVMIMYVISRRMRIALFW